MEFKSLTLIAPKIQVSEIFPALELIMSHQAINEAIAETNSQEKRNRLLPTHLIIALVIGLSWWSKDSIVDVLKNLIQGLSSSWIPKGIKWKTPSKSSISEARQRVGCAVMTRLFEKLARPMAKMETPSAFLKELRWMAIDGTVFDLPDTEENGRVFGYPGSPKGTKAAFPKARLVILVELGTHLITDALISPYRIGERVRAIKLLRSVEQGMLLTWDRGLHSFKMVKATLERQCHILGRIPKNVKFAPVQELPDGSYLSWINPDRKSKKKGATRIQVRVIEYSILEKGEEAVYRLITDLIDYEMFPSLLLAHEYHWRWEVENTLSEFKTHLNARKTPIRSKKPKLVVQEIYGWLLAHWAVRSLIFRASITTDQSPLRFSFTGTLRILRRAISQFQQALPSSLPYFFSWLISEIADQIIPPRQCRTNPRVVKKRTARAEVSSAYRTEQVPRSKFKARKPIHRTGFTQLQPLTFAVVSSIA